MLKTSRRKRGKWRGGASIGSLSVLLRLKVKKGG